MTPLQRTLDFIRGSRVDRPPFHPIVMRWAAKYAGVKYGEFCLDYRAKCTAMIRCAEDFDIDWVTVMSDPYTEAEAFGLEVEYPEDDLPLDRGGHLADLAAVRDLHGYNVDDHPRLLNRVREIEQFRQQVGEKYFIVGWIEGPIAEYGDIRGLTRAAMDLYDDPGAVHHALDVITQAAVDFVTRQVQAGAHCIGIGDAFCSQIGPALYRDFALPREQRLVEHIHQQGALAKLHICGDTRTLLPDMIKTGADIIDVDHLVGSMQPYMPLLGPAQVLSGNTDPVAVVQDGDGAAIAESVRACHQQTAGRCIVSAGCEVPPGVSVENIHAYRNAVRTLGA